MRLAYVRSVDNELSSFEIRVSVIVTACKWMSLKREIPGRKSNGMELSRKVFSTVWVYRTRLSSFRIIRIRDFLVSSSSFGRDHRELDISRCSRKDDGEAYTLENHSPCMSIITS